MASLSNHLHFLLVPLMLQSHFIPFTQMAKLFSSHGVTVTIVLTPLNATRFNSFIQHTEASNLKIHVLSFPFPSSQVGLPQEYENTDSIPSFESIPLFFAASNLLQDPLEKWLSKLKTLPSCIISDFCLPWTSNVATRFNIPRVVFHGISCLTLLCSHRISQSKVHESVVSMTEPFVVPDLPHRIELTKAQLPEATIPFSGALDQVKGAELSLQGILVNTFQELEELYVKGYEKVEDKIWCIGPLSLSDRLISNKFGINDHGNSIDNDSEWLKFLNSHKPCSVIYACFGSLCKLETPQLKELALGLEASDSPFIWVIKKSDFCAELEKWVEEERYEERIKGREIIIRGWAPQVGLLSHVAVGGFITHCGWNSTLEGVSAGVQMITWPMFAEQFYNEKLIVEVMKMGVKVGAEGGMVRKEQVKKAIEKVMMEEGEEAGERKKIVKEVARMARKAVEEEGSSHLNCKSFIQHIMAQVHP